MKRNSKITKPPKWVWNWIKDENLRELDNYQYTGEDLSFLVDLFLRDFWNWCIQYVPLSIAYDSLLFDSF